MWNRIGFQTLVMPIPMPNLFNKPFIVVFDLDECLGSFQFGCLVYHNIQPLFKNKHFPIDDLKYAMEEALEASWLRPGIIHILKTCKYYREQKLIKKICLYTNSTDEYKWVTFLVERINVIIETSDIFDVVISRQSPGRTQVSEYEYRNYGGCQPKFVDDVIRLTESAPDTPVLFYDDRIFNLVPSTTGGVSSFQCVSPYLKKRFFIEDHESLLEFIQDTMPDMVEYYLDRLSTVPYICGMEKYTDLSGEIKIPNRSDEMIFEKQTVIEFLPPLLANVIILADSSENQSELLGSLQNQVNENINAHLRCLQ